MTRLSPLRCFSRCCFPLIWVLSSAVAFGQLTSKDRESLSSGIQAATSDLDPARFPDQQEATATVMARIDAVEKYFTVATDPDNREAWLRYLDLDPLRKAIESESSASDLLKQAMSARDRLIGTAPGLELSAVRQLRDAIDYFVDALLFRNPDQSMQMIKGQLASLSKLVREVDDRPTPDEFTAIAARLSLLESSGQSPELVEQFRDTFDRPNAAIMIGSTLVSEAIARPVVRDRPVRDCILGTRLIGTAKMEGAVTAKLFPSNGSAEIRLIFVGNVTSHNDGYNGPIRLKSIGNGQVNATRTMKVDESGILFGETSAQATLSTQITCIQHNLAIVRAIARKQAAKQKPAADRIALRKLRIQVGDQFSSETTEVTPVTPSELLSRAEPMLQRLSLTRPTQSWSSTEDAISVESVFRGPDQLASVVPRPAVSEPFAFAVQIHESAIENAFSVMLAGRSLNEKRLNELLEKVGRLKPAAEEENASEPPFEISFSRSRPVIFEARDQSVRLGLRGTRFAQGDRAPLSKAMEITANYRVASDDNGNVVLQRTGDVDVDFPRERLTLREVGLKPIIQKEFSEIFPEQILDQAIRIKEDAKVQTLRGREFRPSHVDAANGWLTIAFQ